MNTLVIAKSSRQISTVFCIESVCFISFRKEVNIIAVIASDKDTVMVVTFQTGLTAQGSPKLSQRSFSNLKSSASDQDVYDVVVALYGLQDYPLIGVCRNNRIDLTE